MNRLIFLILLTVSVVSCSDVKIRDLTGRIVLDEVKATSDTVDFYIKEIQLNDVERAKAYDFWGEDSPSFNLYVTITNKLNEKINFIPVECTEDFFVGIFSPELKLKHDTLCFGNACEGYPTQLGPKSSVDVAVSDLFLSPSLFFDLTKLDNTAPLLDIIKGMKFYYAPLPKKKKVDLDTIMINRPYRLRTDMNTKITSWSRIR